jgi:hypothetical protein
MSEQTTDDPLALLRNLVAWHGTRIAEHERAGNTSAVLIHRSIAARLKRELATAHELIGQW